MRYIAAYLLNVLGGNATPTSDDVRNVIVSVGIDVDEEKLQFVMGKLAGKNIEEIQTAGLALLSTSVFGTTTQGPEATSVHDEPVKPEEKEKPSENETDSDDDEDESFMNLFDD